MDLELAHEILRQLRHLLDESSDHDGRWQAWTVQDPSPLGYVIDVALLGADGGCVGGWRMRLPYALLLIESLSRSTPGQRRTVDEVAAYVDSSASASGEGGAWR